MSPLAQLIRDHSTELIAQPVPLEEKLPNLESVRCLAFDIYGTLVVSGSGDIGLTSATHRDSALKELLRDYQYEIPETNLIQLFHQLILEDHASSRKNGTEFPEVDIREIWQRFFNHLRLTPPDLEEFAVRYELKTNPVWPMTGLEDLLDFAREEKFTLAIVSNAQFCTPLMFEAFLGKSLEELGFPPELSFYSYQHRQAKPGTFLYQQLANALEKQNISPAETLFIGNDALNDVHPAAQLGFKTALFAGSQRSLRLREDRNDLHPPDAVITSLNSLKKLFPSVTNH